MGPNRFAKINLGCCAEINLGWVALKLTVSLTATSKAGITDQEVEETKTALRGLGLDDSVTVESTDD